MVDFNRPVPPGFVILTMYARAADRLLTEQEQRAIEGHLLAVPEAGAIISGTGGVRKLRFGIGGRGKRGGVRVIYYYRATVGRIYLIMVFAKNARTDLTMHEKQELRRLVAAIDREN